MTATALRPRTDDDIDVPLDGPPTARQRQQKRIQTVGDVAWGLLLIAAGAVLGIAARSRR